MDITEAITELAKYRRKARQCGWSLKEDPLYAQDLRYLLERIRVSTSSFELQLGPGKNNIQAGTREAVERLAEELQKLLDTALSSDQEGAARASLAIPSHLHMLSAALP